GAAVVLSAWLLVSLALTLDVSIPELFRWVRLLGDAFARLWNRLTSPSQAAQAQAGQHPPYPEPAASMDLPPDFEPFNNRQPAVPARPAARSAPAAHPAAPAGPSVPAAGETLPASPGAPNAASASAAPGEPLGASDLAATVPNWKLPVVAEVLDPPTQQAVQTNVDVERARLIEETLASFGAPAHVVEIHRGPTVTQFGVEPDFLETRSGRTRVRVSKIASLADDLALALAAPRIRIQAPVPGRNFVGIEVANTEASRVAMREVLESTVFKRVRSALRFTLGKDVAGAPVVGDLAAMPHLLIAGTTGSGKSVCVNSILCSLLLNNTPNDLRLVLVDPKRVELTGYNGIPHLLSPVVTDAEKVVGALQWMQREMDARYHRFSQTGARNIQDYNGKTTARLPYIVAVIDELADLMMLAPDETERAITRLAQLARATGIHLIIATQRPSVDVVTGLIKANFPARIAFAVASGTDSRVILDQPGAERLLGRGDMLFQAPDAPAPVRLQGVYVSDPEIQRLVDYWRTASAMLHIDPTPAASGEPVDTLPSGVPLRQVALWDEGKEDNADPLYAEAVELVRKEGRASITMLQRRMRIGYTRAARLVDALEEKGIVGPPVSGSQVREVLDYGNTAPPEEDGY
ncbi:MAG TPA: DNA translocase FtsK, partial [Anaerolineaceae bacterium]|nr:DNA translocase FtsK [Anaerolineaceae bacterium]